MIGQTNLDESYTFEISIKMQFFDVAIGIKIPFFRVLVTIEPGRSLLQFVTTNCLIQAAQTFLHFAYRIHEKGGLGENLI